MTIYDDMQAVASDVIAEFKQGVIEFGKLTPGAGPIDDPGPSTVEWAAIDGAARGVRSKYVQDGLAIASDLQVVMPARVRGTLYNPDPKDFIRIDGVQYKIVHISRRPEAGTAVAFLLIVRK